MSGGNVRNENAAQRLKQAVGSAPAWSFDAVAGVIAAMVVSSLVTSLTGMFAAGVGALLAVLMAHRGLSAGLRHLVLIAIGLLAVVASIWLVPWLAGSWLVASLVGIEGTLLGLRVLTFALLAFGIVLCAQTISRMHPCLAILNAILVMAAIGSRFAAHRNYRWDNPRFLADWAGIEGYELPLVFSVLGFLGLLAGLIALMRGTDGRHAVRSLLSVAAFLLIFFVLAGSFLRNPVLSMTPPGGDQTETSADGDDSSNDSSGESGASREGGEGGGTSQGNASDGSSSESDDESGESASSTSAGGGSSKNDNDPLPGAASPQASPEPIAMVLLEDQATPFEQAWYFRQNAASQFNGRRLVTASDDTIDTDIIDGFPDERLGIGGIYLPEDMYDEVPMVVHVLQEQSRPFGLPSVIEYEPHPNPDPNTFRQSFRVTSRILHGPIEDDYEYDLFGEMSYYDPGDSEWDDATWEHYTRLPEDERYEELAKEILAERMPEDLIEDVQDSAMLKTLAIKRWMDDNTIYSLNPEVDDRESNPADAFLFGNRKGYCTHIAHASVYLMRSIGLPARIGTGYLVPLQRSGNGASIMIQSTDAHAWPEIYIDGFGWVIVDVSPAQIDPETPMPPELPKAVGKLLADKARNKSKHKQELESLSGGGSALPSKRQTLLFVLLLLAIAYAIKVLIWLAPRFVGKQDLVFATHRALIMRLAELGWVRGYGETRTEFGQRIHHEHPEMLAVAQWRSKQLFGRGTHVEREDCVAMQRDLSRRLSESVPWFRRWLGRSDPRFWKLIQ